MMFTISNIDSIHIFGFSPLSFNFNLSIILFFSIQGATAVEVGLPVTDLDGLV